MCCLAIALSLNLPKGVCQSLDNGVSQSFLKEVDFFSQEVEACRSRIVSPGAEVFMSFHGLHKPMCAFYVFFFALRGLLPFILQAYMKMSRYALCLLGTGVYSR